MALVEAFVVSNMKYCPLVWHFTSWHLQKDTINTKLSSCCLHKSLPLKTNKLSMEIKCYRALVLEIVEIKKKFKLDIHARSLILKIFIRKNKYKHVRNDPLKGLDHWDLRYGILYYDIHNIRTLLAHFWNLADSAAFTATEMLKWISTIQLTFKLFLKIILSK